MMTTFKHSTGRIYDFPQVLEITDVAGGWHFRDAARHIDGFVAADAQVKEIFDDCELIAAFVLESYDKGEYEESDSYRSRQQPIEK